MGFCGKLILRIIVKYFRKIIFLVAYFLIDQTVLKF